MPDLLPDADAWQEVPDDDQAAAMCTPAKLARLARIRDKTDARDRRCLAGVHGCGDCADGVADSPACLRRRAAEELAAEFGDDVNEWLA